MSALSNGAAAEGVLGQADFTHGSLNRGVGVGANTLYGPYGIFVDSAGRLWVADYGNNRVLRFDHAASKADGADADGVLGQPGFTSDSQGSGQSGMYRPIGVSGDPEGRLWVAEMNNNRVLRFDQAASKPNGGSADGVLGQPGFLGSNDPATSPDGMNSPIGLFVDWAGRLWVSELNNNRVLRFDDAAAKPDGAEADGVLGQASFTSSGSGCTQSTMYRPRGIGGDLSGRLYVSNSENQRVLIFDAAAALSDGANASGLLGQSNFLTCGANSGGISAASLYTPSGAFYDTQANILWVAEFV